MGSMPEEPKLMRTHYSGVGTFHWEIELYVLSDGSYRLGVESWDNTSTVQVSEEFAKAFMHEFREQGVEIEG